MEIRAHILAFAMVLALDATVSVAHAKSLDPTLSRLVLDPACNWDGVSTIHGQYQPSYFGPDDPGHQRPGQCAPNQAAFKKLVNQWAFIVAPTATHTARTVGYGGFEFSLQAAYTKIDNGSDYWKLGTEGERDPSTGDAPDHGDPPGIVSLYSVNARKSFGFGLETGLNVGFLPNSSLITGGADIRLSLLEGFRTGIGGIFPDVAVGGAVRTITGSPELQLTVAGLDVEISKPLPIADASVLSPWIGFQQLWIFGDSGVIDLTPATDPLGYCGYSGNNSPGTPGSSPPYDGQPVCKGGQAWDFNNNRVFDRARLERSRLIFGMNYTYEMLTASSEFITDIVPPADAQNDTSDAKMLRDCDASGNHCKSVPRQWTMVLELGVVF